MGGFISGLGSSLSGSGGGGSAADAVKKIKYKFERKKGSTGSSSTSGDSGGDTGWDSYHRGGIVKKTGLARLKKGERVLTKMQQRKLGMRKRMRGK